MKKSIELPKADYYVSPDGDDQADGSRQRPLATFEKARDVLRSVAKREGGYTVRFAPGRYRTDGLLFDSRDSGTKACPIRYVAEEGAVLTGSIFLDPNDFLPVEAHQKSRLSAKAQKHVRYCDLKKYGYTSDDWGKSVAIGAFHTAQKYDGIDTGYACELFYNDRRMTLARYPNKTEFLAIDAVPDVGDVAEFPEQNYFETWERRRNHRGGAYIMDRNTTKRVKTWEKNQDIWMFGYFYHDWADSSTPVLGFDLKHRIVKPVCVSRYGCKKGAPYFFYNVFEELDEPGEWYLDRTNGHLYMYPFDEYKNARIELSIGRNELIKAEGLCHVTFEGFGLQAVRNDAVHICGDNNTIKRCTIKNVAGSAVVVHGKNNRVHDCEITQTGKGGIFLSGGDRATLQPAKNEACNNWIYDWAVIHPIYQPAVHLSGVGQIVAHNEMHDAPHMAIGYEGNDHLIEYNLIHDVVTQSTDAGAIYAGRDWTAQGTVIRYNVIYSIGSKDYHPDAIYWDDALSGQTAYGNFLMDIPKCGFLIGGGRNNRVFHNVLIDVERPIHYDDRARQGFKYDGWFQAAVNRKTGVMWRNLESVPYQSKSWAEKYPDLANVTGDFDDDDNPRFAPNPANADIFENLIINPKQSIGYIAPSVIEYGKVASHRVYTSIDQIGFIDPTNGNYALDQEVGAACDLPGFPPIAFDRIGRWSQ